MSSFDGTIVKDTNGRVIREYDDVELMRAAVFSRSEGASILTHIVPKGGTATVISIFELVEPGGHSWVLELEANDGVFFHFELPENVAFAKSSAEKTRQEAAG